VTVVADVLDAGRAPLAVAEVGDKLGGLDILVNIIGQAAWSGEDRLTPGAWGGAHRCLTNTGQGRRDKDR